MKIVLVGESNPYGSDPVYALYPLPEGCTGYRLCNVLLEMDEQAYLDQFDRINLCSGVWDMEEAKDVAERLKDRVAVLCGKKVANAFGYKFEPLVCHGTHIIIPHPSGANFAWRYKSMVVATRETLQAFVKEHSQPVIA